MSGKKLTGLNAAGRNSGVKRKQRKKLNAKGKLVIFTFAVLVILASAAATYLYLTGRKDHDNLKKEVVLEAGSRIRIEDFFSDCPSDARFITDVSDIDTDIPAVYLLTVFYERTFKEDVTLKIEDHTGPDGIAVAQEVYTTWKMPEAMECVDRLYDLSGIAKVEYEDGTPKFAAGGLFNVHVVVTDMYGNNTKISVPFTVIDDRSAPVIEGVHDIDITGDAKRHNLMEGVFAYDDTDPDPIVSVNDSMVRYDKSGEYEITYSAIDKAGNMSSINAKLTIKLPNPDKKTAQESSSTESSSGSSDYSSSSDNDSSEDPVYEIAADVMSSLWRSNDVETARAIFNWVHSHISYQSITTWMSYEDAAYRGFTRRSGDCYVYFSCAKMLLDCAGIPNLMVERYPVYTNGHYWNLVQLNGEWYHCDATVFRDHPAMYFMCTDDEIADSHHSFNGSLYPERAGGSTSYLDTSDPEPSVTPSPSDISDPSITPSQPDTSDPATVPSQPDTSDSATVPSQPDTPAPSSEPSGIPDYPEEPEIITEPDGPAEITGPEYPDTPGVYPGEDAEAVIVPYD